MTEIKSESNVPDIKSEDDAVQYIIVNKSLDMPVGKIAAQCAHASREFIIGYCTRKLVVPSLTEGLSLEDRVVVRRNNSHSRTIVLAANSKEFNKIKEQYENNCIVIRDAGFTCVEPGTETVICLYPMFRKDVPKNIKRLQCL